MATIPDDAMIENSRLIAVWLNINVGTKVSIKPQSNVPIIRGRLSANWETDVWQVTGQPKTDTGEFNGWVFRPNEVLAVDRSLKTIFLKEWP